jgi:hypothetical protein
MKNVDPNMVNTLQPVQVGGSPATGGGSDWIQNAEGAWVKQTPISLLDEAAPVLDEITVTASKLGITPAQVMALGGAAAAMAALGGGGAGGATTAPAPLAPVEPVTVTPSEPIPEVQAETPVEPVVTPPVATPTTAPVEPVVTSPVTTTTTPVEPVATPPVTTTTPPVEPVATSPVTTAPVEPVATPPVTTTTPPVEPPALSPVEPVNITPSQPIPEVQAVSPAPVETPPAPYTGPGIGEVPNPAEVPVSDAVANPPGTPQPGLGGTTLGPISATDAALMAGGAYLGSKLLTTPAAPGKRNYGPIPPTNWGSVAQIGQPGLNPGYLMGQTPAEFAGGTPTQATHYWGVHPYVTDLAHIADYNNIPPSAPYGVAYAQGVGPNRLNVDAFIRQLLGTPAQAAAVGTAYPGPIAPGNKG